MLEEPMEGNSSVTRKRVAIMGAGVTGLYALRHFGDDSKSKLVAYEVQNRLRGVWNYPPGCEDFPDAPITSEHYCRMYRGMRVNAPRDLNRFPELPLHDSSDDSYVSRESFQSHLHEYGQKCDLNRFVKLRHRVNFLEPLNSEAGPCRWRLFIEDLTSQSVAEEVFDIVLVCNGRHEKLHLPNLPGLNSFRGPVIHSAHYRSSEAYADKSVLIVGGATSANDIALELLPVAKKVTMCRRRQLNIFPKEQFPNIIESSTDV
ncbi:putative Flavin-containing monooxygenase FMO GS-OX-like 3 [Hypsibius exemplaris]|uniref:Flavin-containing monooxygenase n=1 Tax=Hypsibius exemplaris TaxID=2072580 RepID=A0A9X6NBB6_HYPEX|nr:putative Flavin-containing monooxygenase FMO GS-OX-like 3 [Hypsibius exemplaris]